MIITTPIQTSITNIHHPTWFETTKEIKEGKRSIKRIIKTPPILPKPHPSTTAHYFNKIFTIEKFLFLLIPLYTTPLHIALPIHKSSTPFFPIFLFMTGFQRVPVKDLFK